MKRFILALVLGACLGSAHGSTLHVDTFEDLGVNWSQVTQRTIAGIDVSISIVGGGNVVAGTYNVPYLGYDDPDYMFGGAVCRCNDPLNPENVSLDRFVSWDWDSLDGINPAIVFDFAAGVDGFGLTTVDLLEDFPNTETDWVSLKAFDASGNLISEHTRVGNFGPSGFDLDWFVSSDTSNIVKVQLLRQITHRGGYAIDDLVLSSSTAIPIPAAAWLFGSALGLLAWMRRRNA